MTIAVLGASGFIRGRVLEMPHPERAERTLLALRADSSVELVMLRPGIVYGPRSRWTAGWADDLLAGRAYLIGDGAGICNAIYVDTLVHAIRLATEAPAAAVDGQAF